jgi:prevent-host-death family protein
MIDIGILDAETKFKEILNKVRSGEEVIIRSKGRGIARIIPYRTQERKRKIGTARGKIKTRGDFNAPLPEGILREFYK